VFALACVFAAVCPSTAAWADGSSTGRAAKNERCANSSTLTTDHEVRGTTRSGTLWGLLLGPGAVPPRAGDELKIVWRMTGQGPLRVRFTAPDGKPKPLAFGPEAHRGASSYQRPGDEWGTGFRFTTPGCWHIRLTRSNNVGDVWLDVRSITA